MLLRDSEYKGGATFRLVRELASAGLGEDRGGYRAGFLELVRQAEDLQLARAAIAR
jgi:Ca-activated chloride channel family protein